MDGVLMKKTVVRVVCAIGQAGQLGLKGRLPWEGERSPEFVADVARFFDLTRGHVLLAGPKTIASVPDFARADRELVVVRSSMDPEDTLQRFAGRVVFIGGGPPVWDAYARFVSHWDVTRLPYGGPADRWFDARWLTGGGEVASNHRDQ
jgi:dihydromethanopterin reductase